MNPNSRLRAVSLRWLLAAGVVFMLGSCQRAPAAPPFRPVASVADLMEGLVAPLSDHIFNAAVWENGQQVGAPKNDEEWEAVHHSALALAEAGNLLMMAPRAKDNQAWMALAGEFIDRSVEVAKAADTKQVEAVFTAGAHLYDVCARCHKQYPPPAPPPSSTAP